MKRIFVGLFIFTLFLTSAVATWAYTAASSNYRLEKDSVNFSGGETTASSNFSIRGTLGEIVSGLSGGSNYNASTGYRYMNLDVESSSTPPVVVPGCTDSRATNYNPAATRDDGSCQYPSNSGSILGCTDPTANNYNPAATQNDRSCTYNQLIEGILGCLDRVAINYNPVATQDDGSCRYLPGTGGCTDPRAKNYNPAATRDDGSCLYGSFSTTTEEIITNTSGWDIRFIQPQELIKTFDAKKRVWIVGAKNLTIRFNYDLAPAVLKTIGVTLTDPLDQTKTFSFLMHKSADNLAYEATISPLIRAGNYPIDIYIINYNNNDVKKIAGQMIVSGRTLISSIENPLIPLAATAGLVLSFLPTLYDLLVSLTRLLGYFFGRRRQENPWGTVYDAVTKRPLDPVYLTINQDDKELATAITDIDGRYSFFLPAGTYSLKGNKTHYRFPSEKLQGKTSDELYDHLYFGDKFTTNGEAIINLNIPMDPIDFDWNEFAKTKTNFFAFYEKRRLWLNRLYKLVFTFGFLFSLYALVTYPSWWNIIIVALYFGLMILNYFWVGHQKPLQVFGRAGEPLPFAIIRVFLPDLNQQIKYAVADQFGRFYLLVRPGVYYYTVEEKQADGSYQKVFQSVPVNLPKGVLTANIYVK